MSPHTYRRSCLAGARRGATAWQGTCGCGWEGDRHEGGAETVAPDKAMDDYRAHVEEQLGAGAYYDAPVACKNCGADQTQGILVGTAVYENPCGRCGITMLQPNNEAWNERRATWSPWS